MKGVFLGMAVVLGIVAILPPLGNGVTLQFITASIFLALLAGAFVTIGINLP